MQTTRPQGKEKNKQNQQQNDNVWNLCFAIANHPEASEYITGIRRGAVELRECGVCG